MDKLPNPFLEVAAPAKPVKVKKAKPNKNN